MRLTVEFVGHPVTTIAMHDFAKLDQTKACK